FLPSEEDPELSGYESLDEGTTSGYGEISSVDRNPQTGTVRVEATNGGGTQYPWGIERYGETIVHETSDERPENTSVRGEHWTEVELEDRTLLWQSELLFRSDLKNFYYTYTRRLLENGEVLREKTWRDTIPRDFQ
ncbi:MAG: hypothetical protein WBO71_14920, partial [Thermoanaerobaculia bacterium]